MLPVGGHKGGSGVNLYAKCISLVIRCRLRRNNIPFLHGPFPSAEHVKLQLNIPTRKVVQNRAAMYGSQKGSLEELAGE